jgi:hypothetical protein
MTVPDSVFAWIANRQSLSPLALRAVAAGARSRPKPLRSAAKPLARVKTHALADDPNRYAHLRQPLVALPVATNQPPPPPADDFAKRLIAVAAGVRNEKVDPKAWIDDHTSRPAHHAPTDMLAVLRRVRPALLIGGE